jgi:hypothetical protein
MFKGKGGGGKGRYVDEADFLLVSSSRYLASDWMMCGVSVCLASRQKILPGNDIRAPTILFLL